MRSGARWTTVLQVAAKLHMAAATLIAARTLDLSDFGLFFSTQAVGYLLASTWDFGSTSLAIRQVAARAWTVSEAVLATLRLRVLLAAAILLPAAFLLKVADDRLAVDAATLALVAAAPFVLALSTAWNSALIGAGRFGAQVRDNVIGRSVALLTLPLALLPTTSHGALRALGASFLLGEVATLCLQVRHATPVRLRAVRQSAPAAGRVLRACLPYAGSNFLSLVYNRGDVLLVGLLAGTAAAGNYAPASQLQNIVVALPALLTAGLVSATATDKRRSEDLAVVHSACHRAARTGLIIALPVSAAVFVLAPLLTERLLGAGLAGATTPVRIIIWVLPLLVIVFPVSQALIAVGEARNVTLLTGLGFGVSAGLHVILDPRFGAVGGAVASAARDPIALIGLIILYRTRVLNGSRAGRP